MPSPYSSYNGLGGRKKRRRRTSKHSFDIGLAAMILFIGMIIGAFNGGNKTEFDKPSSNAVTSSQSSTSSRSSKSAKSSNGSQSSQSSTSSKTASQQAHKQSAGQKQGQKPSQQTSANDLSGSARATVVLTHLAVKGRAPKTGYRRTQFGPAWADVDHNGCDTRNDILTRDLTNKTYRPGTHDCVVTSGILRDPYTGTTIYFKRGRRTSSQVQIDHVVALSDAWQTGAQQLAQTRREQLANDPYNLLAVQGRANQQKSDSDAASWLPANKAERCPYVARQIGVKRKYGLWVTNAEKAAMQQVLHGCPAQNVPHG